IAKVYHTLNVQVGGCMVIGCFGCGETQNTVRLACPCGKLPDDSPVVRRAGPQRFPPGRHRPERGYKLFASSAYWAAVFCRISVSSSLDTTPTYRLYGTKQRYRY